MPNCWKSGLVIFPESHGFSSTHEIRPESATGFSGNAIHAWAISIEWGPFWENTIPRSRTFCAWARNTIKRELGTRDADKIFGSGRFGQLKEVEGFCCATCIAHCFYMDTSNQQHLTKWQSPLKSHSSTISCLTFRTAQYTALKTQLSLMKCDSLLGKI